MKLAASRLLFFDRAIGRRLYLIVLIMALGLLGILAITAVELRESLFAAKEAETRHLVETAYSLVADYQRRAAQGEISEAAARQEALNRLSRLGYEQDQYFWVNDMAGKMLMHPIPQPVGTKVLDMRDAGGGYPFRDMIAVVSRQGAGLALYYRPPDASARLKQSYVRGVSGWNTPPPEPGASGAISLQGMATPVPFVVRGVDDRGALHLEFEADEAVRPALYTLLDQLQQRRVA